MKVRLTILSAAFLSLAHVSPLPASPPSAPLDLLGYFQNADAWSRAPDAFLIENRPYGFQFLDAERTTAFSPEKGRMTFGRFYVYETRVYWRDAAIRRVEVSIYNKGDANLPVTKAQFEKSVRDLSDFLTQTFGNPEREPDARPAPRKVVRRLLWKRKAPLLQLEWAFVEPHSDKASGFQIPYTPEYIRVVMVPKTGHAAADNAQLTGRSILVRAKNLRQLRENIVRNSKGDVVIENVPMVDQGQKGYCAAASAERIIRYFGIDVDQHQIAQLAETSARGGTGIEGFTDAITAIGKSYSLDQKNLIPSDAGKSFQESQVFRDLKDYNATAKRAKKPPVVWEDYTLGHMVDVSAIWNALDPQILMESRLRRNQDFTKFLANIRSNVDAGIPLFWSCLVGIYPEVPDLGAQGAFGHMRLIIGYNSKTHEILYSDSWGANHALKRMPEKQAWAMTRGLLVLKPRL